ncbi:MAG TPA: trehalase family glycosidase [Treponemataceae bacterium]|nr:trehalase family glycosidase [Treponemataceae bacterium]
MNKHDFPKIHFYDQDFVDVYDKTWAWLQDFWRHPKSGSKTTDRYFMYHSPEDGSSELPVVDQLDSTFSSFFLVYSNRNYPAHQNLDYLYSKQEESGAIRWKYNVITNEPIFSEDNPEGVGLPLFAWAEYNLYHKSANKKRVKEVMPLLQKYMLWLETTFKHENGLYQTPFTASGMFNAPREGTSFPVDFNAALATNALYMSALGDILNDKEISFQYKRLYFSLKTRINSLMWNQKTGLYHDLDDKTNRLPQKTIAGFWPMLAEIPNEDKANKMVELLTNPSYFGTYHPFPSLSADDPSFSKDGNAYCGSVFPLFNFMVIKGLEKYEHWNLARESAIKHLYFMLEGMFPANSKQGDLYEAYLPTKEGIAKHENRDIFPRKRHLFSAGLSTIALMVENIIGLEISLPRKTVDWIIPNLEIMGIENLSLKRNLITILSNKSNRGWEIQMESEKLYYFTINILGKKKKTLPIPSGKCSMLIDKL